MRLKAWLVAVCAVALVAAGGLWLVARYEDRILPAVGLGRRVVLYFASPDGMGLVPDERFVLPWQDDLMTRLRLLARGPRPGSGLAPVIPPGARPLGANVEDGVATVDFSREIVERHWGGSTGELMTVYGIVNTLTAVPGIHRVRILVEGKPVETLAGHVDLTQPLEADPSLVLAPPSPADAGGRSAP